MKFYRSAVLLAHQLWGRYVHRGSKVIDATCGRGHDATILCNLIFGPPPLPSMQHDIIALPKDNTKTAWLHCIDIQAEALESTRNTLSSAGYIDHISYHHQSHELFPASICENSISAVVYNLGYLPKGDKSIISKPGSTVTSIHAAAKLLTPSGLISIMSYRGHPGGVEEYENVVKVMDYYRAKQWRIDIVPSSAHPTSPVLISAIKPGS